MMAKSEHGHSILEMIIRYLANCDINSCSRLGFSLHAVSNANDLRSLGVVGISKGDHPGDLGMLALVHPMGLHRM